MAAFKPARTTVESCKPAFKPARTHNKLKQNFSHLKIFQNKKFSLINVIIFLGQFAYELQRPISSNWTFLDREPQSTVQ